MPWGDNHTETGQRYNKHVYKMWYYIKSRAQVREYVLRRQMTNIFIYFKTGLKFTHVFTAAAAVCIFGTYTLFSPCIYCIVHTHCTQYYNMIYTHVDGGGSMTFFKKNLISFNIGYVAVQSDFWEVKNHRFG